MTRLLASGLNRDAIIVLLNDKTSVGKRAIIEVLDGLESLARRYVTGMDRENLLNTSIHGFELSARACNVFRKNKIVTLRDLLSYSAYDLRHMQNFGESTLEEIREFLDGFQMKLLND